MKLKTSYVTHIDAMRHYSYKVKKRKNRLTLFFEKINPEYYLAAVLISGITGFVLYNYFPNGYQTSVMLLVNNTNDGRTMPVSVTNNLNDFSTEISAFADGRKVTVKAVDTNLNAVNLKVITSSPIQGTEILQRIIYRYNRTHRYYVKNKNNLGIDDSIQLIREQLQKINTTTTAENITPPPDRVLETLEALTYYVKQPVSQFSQIPNTFDVHDDYISALIEKYNLLQNNKQHLLTEGEELKNEILVLNSELLTVQQILNKAIRAKQNTLKHADKSVKINETDETAKNKLLQTYNRLVKAKAPQTKKRVYPLTPTGLPVITIVHTPYVLIGTLSLLAGIFVPFVFDRIITWRKRIITRPGEVIQ